MGEFQGREPCPARICDDIGGAFAMGAVGGGIWHSVKGFRNAPKNSGFTFAVDAAKARAPVTGGSFATWGALFATFDCTFAYLRRKEDPWNSIASGATTGGLLAARAGPRAAGKNAVIGGILLAAIEGLGIMITRMTAAPLPTAADYEAEGRADPLQPPSLFGSAGPGGGTGSLSDIFSSDSSSDGGDSSSSSFGSLFGGSDSSSSSSEPPASFATPPSSANAEPTKKAWYDVF